MIAATPRPPMRFGSAALRPVAIAAFLAVGCTGALAQSCNDDIGAIQQKRNTQLEALNKITKANKGKLDPVSACPRLRTLAALEREMLAYMQKNQSWCSIPDQLVEQVKTGSARTAQIAGQACKIAAQAKQMQSQQQSQGPAAPALPRGPL